MLEESLAKCENVDKRLRKLRGEKVSKKDKISEIPENTDKVSEIPENTEITETTTFEQLLRKRIKEDGIVEVFERKDGTLKMHAVQIIDRGLFLSLCVNAVLFVLLLTHIVGMW